MAEHRHLHVHLALILIVLLAITTTTTIDAGRPLRILGLFPHVGQSHFHFFHPIMRGLAEAGHDVTVVSHFVDKSPPVRYRDLKIKSDSLGENFKLDSIDLHVFEKRPFWKALSEFFVLYDIGKECCNATLRSDAVHQVLHEKKRYDVVIVEAFNSDCMLGIAHSLKAPIVALTSSAILPWSYERFGIPIIPSFMPATFLGYSHDMSFLERVTNWINWHVLNLLYDFLTVPSNDAMLRHKFGHDMPSVKELSKDVSVLLTNTHFSLNGVKPLPPSVIEVGGVHIQKAKALPMEIQRWLDNAEHGVIVISWGSMVRGNSLPAEKRDGLLRAIKRLKYRVLWKWENETLPNQPENVLIRKWLPQRDILCHPNVKIFMGHGGLLGTSEAVHCGVPMVVTPIYGDQFLNAAAVKSRGIGVVLPFEDMSENSILKAIKKASEKSFSDNAKTVAHSYNHRPMTALQTAIWWVEYVARTEGAPLTKPSSVYLPAFVYHSLDVYLILGLPLGAFISLLVWAIRNLYLKRFRKQKAKTN